MDIARYIVGILIVIFLPPGLLWWFIVHPFVSFWRRVGPKGTLTVMGVIGVSGAIALFQIRDLLLVRDLGTSPLLLVVAAILFTVSTIVALKRRRYLTNRILAGIPELDGPRGSGELLKEGIYARIRHPRYVEIALGTFAYATFANYLGAYIVAAVTLPLLHLIVILEERELLERFGEEYEAYRASVPRYIPRRG